MQNLFHPNFKAGILGGGQLGKMLCLAAQNWDLYTAVLDQSADFPAGKVCTEFKEGSFKDFEDVMAFGQNMSVLTIEIEHVNTEALEKLEAQGVVVHPSPRALSVIKDKGFQKQFYRENGIPTAPFELFDSPADIRAALEAGKLNFPFVQKSRTAGYDGRGVVVIHSPDDLDKLLPGAAVIEPKVPIEKELAVIVARNERGETATYPLVEMEFDPVANLVEFLNCPAAVSGDIARRADQLARQTIEAYDLCGLLAVELFLTQSGDLMVNEVAPRTHNSGHHTIDSCYTSQFEQQWRAILNLPLGSTKMKTPAVMVNLLGAEGHQGPVAYEGLSECLAVEGVKIHLYGKKITKPFRKMGHATILAESPEEARKKAIFVRNTLRIVAENS